MENRITNKTDYSMEFINSADIKVLNRPKGYQRDKRDMSKILKIVAEFDERIANEPKLSFRDGHYYCFDGQHTIAARKIINGGKDLLIRCKVFYNQTLQDEAYLFAAQTGTSSKPTPAVKLHAQIIARDPRAIAFKCAAAKAGVIVEKKSTFGQYRLGCVNTAMKEFDRIGSKLFIEGLNILMEAWDGDAYSLRADMIEGIMGFVEIYHGMYDRAVLIKQLKKHTPKELLDNGKIDLSLYENKRFINQIFSVYNDAFAEGDQLPIKF